MSVTDFASFHAAKAKANRAIAKAEKKKQRDEWVSKRRADVPRVQQDLITEVNGLDLGDLVHKPKAFINRTQVNIDFESCKTRLYTTVSTTSEVITFRFMVPKVVKDIDDFMKVVRRHFLGRYTVYTQHLDDFDADMVLFSVPDGETEWAMERFAKLIAPLLASLMEE